MKNRKGSRYQNLSREQVYALRNHDANIEQHHALNSFIGNPKHKGAFDVAWKAMKKLVSGWQSSDYWKYAFLEYCNASERASSRTAGTAYSNFRNGFFEFWTSTNRTNLDITDIDTTVIHEFIKWTRTGEYVREDGTKVKNQNLSENTRYRRYQLVKHLIDIICKSKLTNTNELNQKIRFPQNPYAFRHMRTEKTEPLQDEEFSRLIEAAQKEAFQVMASTRAMWKLLEEEYISPDYSAKGRGIYRTMPSALWEIAKMSNERLLPTLRGLLDINPALSDAISRFHGGYRTICRPFEPSSADIYPFLLLYSIYTAANTGPLRALKLRDIRQIRVLGQERISLTFHKNRSSSYEKSFNLDTTDPLSPYSIYLFLVQWTKRIRKFSGDLQDNLFIYKSTHGHVSNFLNTEHNGRDSDSSWKHHTVQFCKKHNLVHFSNRTIRESGLDLVRENSDDDMRSIQAISGNKSAAVIRRHYDGSSAENRGNEKLGQGMMIQERWTESRGKIDPRGASGFEDINSATPGWSCLDPFSSPFPENRKGKLCQSYGFCPKCEMAFLEEKSPYALARILQLIGEIDNARDYLSTSRWHAAYEPVLERLKNFWLPQFTDINTHTEALKISLKPLARIE